MIYVCIPSRNEARTIGLVLWKVRQVFAALGREYQLLVVDDGSDDDTVATLEPYQRALPLTVIREDTPQGYPHALATLLTATVARTDRPKRDSVVILHADFRHSPDAIPEMVKRIDSGADLVVGEGRLVGDAPRGYRMLRRVAPHLLRGHGTLPHIRDTVSGCFAVRLATVRYALKDQVGAWLGTAGWAANAEALARLASHARKIASVPIEERLDRQPRPTRIRFWAESRRLWGSAKLVPPVTQPKARSPDRPRRRRAGKRPSGAGTTA